MSEQQHLVPLSQEDITEMAKKLSETCVELAEVEAKKKVSTSKSNAKIKELKAYALYLAFELKGGEESQEELDENDPPERFPEPGDGEEIPAN